MFDKELLDCVLERHLKNREQLHVDLQELNAYTELEDKEFEERTKKIEDLKDYISKNDFIIKDDYLRLAADFDNYKKRVAKNESYAHDKAFQDVILHFLDLYDDMERLNKSLQDLNGKAKVDMISSTDVIESGFSIIFENFEKTLSLLHCKKIDCNVGDAFDPTKMDAISISADDKYEIGVVTNVFQSGWMYNDKILRPIKVVVKQ